MVTTWSSRNTIVAAAVVSHTYSIIILLGAFGKGRGGSQGQRWSFNRSINATIHEIENTIVTACRETKRIRLRNHKGARARAGE